MKRLLLSAVCFWLCLLIACGGSSGTKPPATPTLRSITVTAVSSSIAVNQTTQFTATGTYSDNSTKDLTSTVTWSSSTPTVATISSAGLATGKSAGSTTMLATTSNVTGNAALTVTNPLLSVTVTPPNKSVGKGATVQYTATGLYTDGSTQNLTSLATWASTDSTIAPISTTGLVMAIQPGAVTISATYTGMTGTTPLTVTTATVASVAVTPSNPSVVAGLTVQFTAMATYTDSTTQDVTATAAWASSNPSLATTPVAGFTTGLKPGMVLISATASGVTGSTNLTVKPAQVLSIMVTPASAKGHPNFTVPFDAMAKMTDGTTQDITFLSTTTWNTDSTTVATISNTTGTNGQATCVAAGTANITATSSNGMGGNVTSNVVPLTVASSVLQTISVTPPTPTVSLGSFQQFTATGNFSDSTTEDLTRSAVWTSTDTTIATMVAGQAAVIGIGTANITAAQAGVTSSAAALTADSSQLVSIRVQPATAQIGLETSRQFTAIGTFQNGSTLDITALVTWKSGDERVALVGPHTGLATAKSLAGKAVIMATLGLVNQTAELNVSSAKLTKITVTPPNSTLPVHATEVFSAVGTLSDGTNQALTSADVTWTSSNTKNVFIANPSGQATAKLPTGSTPVTITATFSGDSTIMGSTPMNVSGAALTSLSITPANAVLTPGSSLNYTAVAQYSDGTQESVSGAADFASSLPKVATFNNNTASALAPGISSITASLNGSTSNAATLIVESAPPASIAVSPATASVAAQVSTQLQATGTFADGNTQDVTSLAFWTSDAPSIATVSNDPGAEGLATTSAIPGSAALTAVLAGQTSSAALTATGATLTSITVSPANPTLSSNQTQQFTATGTFSDMSTLDLTNQVGWSSSNAAASVINSAGLATAIATGQTTITASMNGQTGTTTLTVQ